MVSAAATGIGKSIALAFAEAGARVHICDLHAASLAALHESHGITGSVADVAREDDVARWFVEAEESLGGLDVLVNNAGIAGPTAPLEQVSLSDWQRTLSVNLESQFLCAREAIPRLKRQRSGSIINLSSVAGRLGYALRTPYAASKWGTIGLTESLAIELGPDGIRVNALLPGIVEGPRVDQVVGEKARARGLSFDDMKEQVLASIALRKMVSAQDVAAMAVFLASPAGASISGQSLSICGGVRMMQ